MCNCGFKMDVIITRMNIRIHCVNVIDLHCLCPDMLVFLI